MAINNPSIKFTFGNDLQQGHSQVQSVGAGWIIRNSCTLERNYLNGLKSSSDLFKLTLRKGCPTVEDILMTEKDIKAVVLDGEAEVFTGYVSNNFNWGVDSWGEKDFTITIESVGTRLLKKPYLDEGYAAFDSTFAEAVSAICSKAGVETTGAFPSISIKREVEAGETCEELLSTLCYECGYVFTFDATGKLYVQSIAVELDNAYDVNSSNLYTTGSDAVTVTKRARQYKGAAVSYVKLASKRNVTIYNAESVKLTGNGYFDGAEVHPDHNYTAPYVEAVNALSDTDIASGTIMSISNVSLSVKTKSSFLEQRILFSGGRYFQIESYNRSSQDMTYEWFRVKADVIYAKSTEVIRTTSDTEVIQEQLAWVHDDETARRTANLIGQYQMYCGLSYTFMSKDEIPCGRVCHIVEPLSGLDTYVMVVGLSAAGQIIRYKAVGVSAFNLEAPVVSGTYVPGKIQGPTSISGVYGTYATSEGSDEPSDGWSTEYAEVSAERRYLWKRGITEYSDSEWHEEATGSWARVQKVVGRTERVYQDIFDKNAPHENGYYTVTGSFVESDTLLCYTISVVGGRTYTRYSNAWDSWAGIVTFWRGDTFISGTNIGNNASVDFTVPTNADKVKVIAKTTTLNNELKVLTPTLVSTSLAGVKVEGRNLFNKDAVATEKWLNNMGEVVSASEYAVTDFIPIKPLTKYFFGQRESSRTMFYDASKNVLNGGQWGTASSGAEVFTTPASARYVRVTVSTSNSAIKDNFMLVESDVLLTEYIPYREPRTYGFPLDLRAWETWEDGTITSQCGEVDLGSLTWQKLGGANHLFVADVPNVLGGGQFICSKETERMNYVSVWSWSTYWNRTDYHGVMLYTYGGASQIGFKFDKYENYSVEQFKAEMEGHSIVYQTADSTTKSKPLFNPIPNEGKLSPVFNNMVEADVTFAFGGHLTTTTDLIGTYTPPKAQFLGISDFAPASASVGDYYLSLSDGITKEWNGTEWVAVTDSGKLLDALSIATKSGVDLNAISDANTVSWFKTIIAKKAVVEDMIAENVDAKYIKALDGVFENITVAGQLSSLGLESKTVTTLELTISANLPYDADGAELKPVVTGDPTIDDRAYKYSTIRLDLLQNALNGYGSYGFNAGTRTYGDLYSQSFTRTLEKCYVHFFKKEDGNNALAIAFYVADSGKWTVKYAEEKNGSRDSSGRPVLCMIRTSSLESYNTFVLSNSTGVISVDTIVPNKQEFVFEDNAFKPEAVAYGSIGTKYAPFKEVNAEKVWGAVFN